MTEREESRRSVSDERRYAILSKDSIKLMADAAGHEDIHDTVAGILGEDVSYRLREITQKSAQFMRHARRKRMNTDDFNKACRCSDIPPVHGHGSTESASPFHQVKTEQGETIHCVEDPVLQLAAISVNDYLPKQLGETTIKAHWLAVEGVQKTPQNPQGTPGNKVEANGSLLKYFDKITQAVLGYDAEMMKTALSDLRTNSKISPLLPHFVSFIANGVKTVSHDMGQLTKLLFTVRSLVCNNSLFLEAQPFLTQLTQSVQFCLLETLSSNTASSCDHWSMRDYAARLLSHIISVWGNSVNHLERFTEKALREVFYDHSKPFPSHYGAVMGLLYLGSENIERVLIPHLATYLPHLFATMEYQGAEYVGLQADSCKVHGAIMLSVEQVLRKHIKEFKDQHVKGPGSSTEISETCKTISKFENKLSKPSSSKGFISSFNKSPVSFYLEMSEYFGDSLTLRLPEIEELKTQVFTPSLKEVTTSISDPEAYKSGEELLDELMEQVKQEENVKKRKDRHKYHLVKHEREIEERDRRCRSERERRTADHRHQLAMAYQRKMAEAAAESDNEIDVVDVEGDTYFQSEKSEVDVLASELGLAVTSAIGGAPGQGIKLTFTKKPKFTMAGNAFPDSPLADFTEIKERDTHGRKRKQSSMSPDTLIPDFTTHASGFTRSSLFLSDSATTELKKYTSSKFRKKE